jgi:hypothetical protein
MITAISIVSRHDGRLCSAGGVQQLMTEAALFHNMGRFHRVKSAHTRASEQAVELT